MLRPCQESGGGLLQPGGVCRTGPRGYAGPAKLTADAGSVPQERQTRTS
jgi:hypothetical protein